MKLSDVAADYAEAIERDLGQPVLLHGTSTGGSVALRLAIDHPLKTIVKVLGT